MKSKTRRHKNKSKGFEGAGQLEDDLFNACKNVTWWIGVPIDAKDGVLGMCLLVGHGG